MSARPATIVFCLLLSSSAAFGQARATLAGVVTNGAGMPQATVTVILEADQCTVGHSDKDSGFQVGPRHELGVILVRIHRSDNDAFLPIDDANPVTKVRRRAVAV